MRIEIEIAAAVSVSEGCHARAILFNDGYEPVAVSRNAFIGPNMRPVAPVAPPGPESVEPTFGMSEEPLVLQPFSFYGREREFNGLTPGEVEVTAYYRNPEGQQQMAATRRVRVVPG